MFLIISEIYLFLFRTYVKAEVFYESAALIRAKSKTYAVQECHCKTPERSEFLITSKHKKAGDVVSVNSPRLL